MIKFKDIEVGQWFVLRGDIFIKTITVKGKDIFNYEDEMVDYNCVCLNCSSLDWCPPTAKVEVINTFNAFISDNIN